MKPTDIRGSVIKAKQCFIPVSSQDATLTIKDKEGNDTYLKELNDIVIVSQESFARMSLAPLLAYKKGGDDATNLSNPNFNN